MADSVKTFTYTAHDIHNQLTSGEYSSSNKKGVASYLLGLGLKPVAITEKKKSIFDHVLKNWLFLKSCAILDVTDGFLVENHCL